MSAPVDEQPGTSVRDVIADEPGAARPIGELLGDFREGVVVLVIAACVMSVVVFDSTGQILVTAFTASVLLVLAAIDVQHRILPNRIVLPAIPVVLAAQIAFFPDRAAEWVLAGIAACAFLAAPLVIRRGGMGGGDIKLAALLGVALGWPVFGAMVIGCLAIVPFALWMLSRDGSIRNATLPFGPFLAFGTLVILFTS
ncbi:MAG: prepilin peptidase [Thermoleophilia bacterium]